MANFGPPVIVFGFQTVTFVPGVYQNFFQPAQEVVPLNASRRGEPLQLPTETVPPNVFQQEE